MTDATRRQNYVAGSKPEELKRGALFGAVFILGPALIGLGIIIAPALIVGGASGWFSPQEMNQIVKWLLIGAGLLCIAIPGASAIAWVSKPDSFGRQVKENE